MSDKNIVVGIDLGTTFSAIAYLDEHGKPTIIPNSDNERITPSVVLFEEDEVIVGKIAKTSALSDPQNVIEFIKRDMGQPDEERIFYGKTYTPESISALILKYIINDAQKNIQSTISQAVITVPAYFGDVERKATQDAGEIAGIEVLGVINEPTAAALSYGLDQEMNSTILVYDLGGGTFDVSILHIAGQDIKVLATDGEVQLGGKDWDDEIINYVAEEFLKEHNIDPREDIDANQALRDAAESAKITLSKKEKARIVCQSQGNMTKVTLTREKFEELTRPLLEQSEAYIPVVLEKAKLQEKDIDRVLLVGGSTRMPQVKNMLEKMFSKPADDSVNPDECVALGAALYGAMIKLKTEGELSKDHYLPEDVKEKLTGLTIRNVTAHSLGLLIRENKKRTNFILIPQQSEIPIERSETFGTEADNQTRVVVEVTEGESKDPEECVAIGKCIISGLPPRSAGAPVQVTFKYNEDGRIEVHAVDKGTGKEVRTEILRTHGLSREQIEQEKQSLGNVEL
ncbi:Hsp70 family protein [Candidatus Uabimicrobium sp. HlEnr_7]|uniref:Hsp70 family protein n=1 Tax=Candidatus Uabimicrobium helgolandensis TaxID=3095367 RepID=UPI003557254E